MQRLEVSGVVRPIYGSFGVKQLKEMMMIMIMIMMMMMIIIIIIIIIIITWLYCSV